jgi:hypothetical protein
MNMKNDIMESISEHISAKKRTLEREAIDSLYSVEPESAIHERERLHWQKMARFFHRTFDDQNNNPSWLSAIGM